MKNKLMLPIILTTFIMPLSFAATNPPVSKVAMPSKNAQVKEGKILGVMMVINQNEIAAAKEAERKAGNPEVKNYALFLDKEHNENLAQAIEISKTLSVPPQKSAQAERLKHKGEKELATLNRFNPQQFDKMYIKTMVHDHAAALKIVTKELKQTSNPTLKQYLAVTKEHVLDHLQKAKMIQRQLKG